ncbi:hypothetical protein HPP92_018660 [Vanilla planifolia]|uniref:Uncharacterized protein n=1 Tax=Vanilla planifolia TaxID=51239 RepID=A0A835UNK3_VANPL|nr:hypothetical protein HPP92_018660 [Vanilla planifolia]
MKIKFVDQFGKFVAWKSLVDGNKEGEYRRLLCVQVFVLFSAVTLDAARLRARLSSAAIPDAFLPADLLRVLLERNISFENSADSPRFLHVSCTMSPWFMEWPCGLTEAGIRASSSRFWFLSLRFLGSRRGTSSGRCSCRSCCWMSVWGGRSRSPSRSLNR